MLKLAFDQRYQLYETFLSIPIGKSRRSCRTHRDRRPAHEMVPGRNFAISLLLLLLLRMTIPIST